MRRLNRKEVQKEEQEKIRLGLLPVPEPKVIYFYDVISSILYHLKVIF